MSQEKKPWWHYRNKRAAEKAEGVPTLRKRGLNPRALGTNPRAKRARGRKLLRHGPTQH